MPETAFARDPVIPMYERPEEYTEVELLKGDIEALNRFLKLNPSSQQFTEFPMHLNAAVLSRVCFALETTLNSQ